MVTRQPPIAPHPAGRPPAVPRATHRRSRYADDSPVRVRRALQRPLRETAGHLHGDDASKTDAFLKHFRRFPTRHASQVRATLVPRGFAPHGTRLAVSPVPLVTTATDIHDKSRERHATTSKHRGSARAAGWRPDVSDARSVVSATRTGTARSIRQTASLLARCRAGGPAARGGMRCSRRVDAQTVHWPPRPGPQKGRIPVSSGLDELNRKMSRYRWYPVLQIGISYRF